MKSLKAAVAASALVSTLALAACSSGTDQTVEEACGVIGDGLMTLTQTDTSDSLDPLVEGLEDISKDVKNREVKEPWDKYVATMKEMVQLISDHTDVAESVEVTEDGEIEESEVEATDVTDEVLEKEEALLNQLEEAQNELDELCSATWDQE